ncbi:MAG: Fe(II)-dependent oxygenase superfamily protein [Phycisphaerales bacterium]|nr:Fe(II)-dependent oxygenase superfamily protein [Phycisphaerales bacterium]MDB5357085.1 Fe(II)-dependent oxygenase superfamily protein [Phycisphaerales bacterium]
MLKPGDPVPVFFAPATSSPRGSIDLAAGHYVVLCFFGSAGDPTGRAVLEQMETNQQQLKPLNAIFCGVSVDREDQRTGRVAQKFSDIIFFWDFDRVVSKAFGALSPDGSKYMRYSVILDLARRTRAVLPFGDNVENHIATLLHVLEGLPRITAITDFAPVLTIPFVFEPEFCQHLIALYDRHGGQDLGTLSEVNGQTVRVHDQKVKSRLDYTIRDPQTIAAAQSRLIRRVAPVLKQAFQFQATRIERHIIARYDAQEGGHFSPHRDDITRGSEHRRFAVTINLNSDEYEGGDLRFQEFGFRTYRAPTGAAIVFSCSLLHEVRPVTRGSRYAFLPFLYDEEAARIRRENQQFLSADMQISDDRLVG